MTSSTTRTGKLVLNVESGDYAVLGERACGCLIEPDGTSGGKLLPLHVLRGGRH